MILDRSILADRQKLHRMARNAREIGKSATFFEAWVLRTWPMGIERLGRIYLGHMIRFVWRLPPLTQGTTERIVGSETKAQRPENHGTSGE